MSDSISVAAYIKARTGTSGLKLQKLLYYSQAWHTVWRGCPLFSDRIEAWKNGPVVRAVYAYEKQGDGTANDLHPLSDIEKDVVDRVLAAYGAKSGAWLSELTHREDPWVNARAGLPSTAPSTAEIKIDTLSKFYGSCAWGENMHFDDAYIRGLDFIVELPEEDFSMLNDTTRLPAEDYLRFMESGDDALATD